MTWSIELIRDGFCVGLGFWFAFMLVTLSFSALGLVKVKFRALTPQVDKLFKRQIDER